ncbi:hypothetical protein EHV15_34465 [Paenibacillus oralis]|uniref:Uncharacterized protein n=1 Tax=Paenibacillus oralis TaxID=2490856 RepID=A0A3P3TE37_9BACL|nr:hypothetical protein [Paenibacillus oralis]RRJ54703.1 hypothetical protein EHV15_34465 [Paenibacillus oralis]
MDVGIESIINKLSEPQRRDLLAMDDWSKSLNIGRGLRTGRFLANKGLVKDTGEMYNYSTRWVITSLGKKVAAILKTST